MVIAVNQPTEPRAPVRPTNTQVFQARAIAASSPARVASTQPPSSTTCIDTTVTRVVETLARKSGSPSDRLARRRNSEEKAKNSPDSTRSEEHTSELQSLMRISYAVFCLKKKKKTYIAQPL